MRTVIPTIVLALSMTLPGASAQETRPPDPPRKEAFGVLVFSKTAGFRHASIPDGIKSIEALGKTHGFRVEKTEDPAVFTEAGLASFDVVVFLNTTGDVLDDAQQSAFEAFIRAGHGYVGVHSAADTEYDWPWYGKLVGAYFKSHPRIQPATVLVTDRRHPATKHLPERWDRRDEWYSYRASPRGAVHVLASLDEGTYEGGGMNGDHPIAWCHEHDGGRAFYTGGGHTKESYQEPAFREHLLGAIRWAAGREPAKIGAVLDDEPVTVATSAPLVAGGACCASSHGP